LVRLEHVKLQRRRHRPEGRITTQELVLFMNKRIHESYISKTIVVIDGYLCRVIAYDDQLLTVADAFSGEERVYLNDESLRID
jgi:hypothetical protein